MRYVKSGRVPLCNPAIFHVAQSGDILALFSPLLAPDTTEKTRRALSLYFLFMGIYHKAETKSFPVRSKKDPLRIPFAWIAGSGGGRSTTSCGFSPAPRRQAAFPEKAETGMTTEVVEWVEDEVWT